MLPFQSVSDETDPKKDLTGLLDLPNVGESHTNSSPLTEEFEETSPSESVESFESLDQLQSPFGSPIDDPGSVIGDFGFELDPAQRNPATESDPASGLWNPTSEESSANPSQPSAPLGKSPMDRIKDFSESVPVGTPSVQASFPFSLLIEGKLTPQEQEKLLDVIHREKMGFSEMDLEPQFAAGKVLIPRISEYAGILIVQALRSIRARIWLGPAESIYPSQELSSEPDPMIAQPPQPIVRLLDEGPEEPERIPVTNEPSLPGLKGFEVIDVVTASATLKTFLVEAQKSPEYEELIEALKKELKYKAFQKGATAILNFEVDLTPLKMASHYKLTALGSAVRPTV